MTQFFCNVYKTCGQSHGKLLTASVGQLLQRWTRLPGDCHMGSIPSRKTYLEVRFLQPVPVRSQYIYIVTFIFLCNLIKCQHFFLQTTKRLFFEKQLKIKRRTINEPLIKILLPHLVTRKNKKTRKILLLHLVSKS